jgi:transglutaminase-like putative cysteine protease
MRMRGTGGFFIRLLWVILLACLPGCYPPAPIALTPEPPESSPAQRQYIVHQKVTLNNQGPGQPQKQNIWVALIRDFSPYQAVLSRQVSPPGYTLITDEYGNQYAEFDFSHQPAGTTQTIQIETRVAVNELSYERSTCAGSLPDEFNQPELHIESANPQIVSLAQELARGKSTACQKVRAFYDYVADTLVYTDNGQNWGAQAALGPMGADCTEYADLLAALSRSQGIPARYFEGLLYLNPGTNSLAKMEHAWLDVNLPAAGWVGLDPTLGRTRLNRDTYFAHSTPDHIIVTLGASPSVLRGSSYWSHLYWPGNTTQIQVTGEWKIEPLASPGPR